MKIGLLKILFPVMTLLMVANLNSVYSQSIEGSTWFACNVYDDSTFLKFEGDTIYFKAPEVQGFENFVAVSLYTVSNDTLLWNDLEASDQCDPNITGRYIFHLNTDTLTFSEIEDLCDFRLAILSELILKREFSTSFSTVFEESIDIFPNPITNHDLTIRCAENTKYNYQVFTSTGHLKMQGNGEGLTVLSLHKFSPGYYFLNIQSHNSKFSKVFKIVKI